VQYVVALPDTPPSFNEVGHTGNRWAWTKAKKLWQRDMETGLMVNQVPRGLVSVTAAAILHFPTKRRRDEGNYRTLLEKCLGDALVNGGWLDDDTPDQFRFMGVEFADGAKETMLILTTP
jgi:hypothetical protein